MLLVRRLIWDAWNVGHIARHAVLPEDVEQVCHSNPVVQAGKKGRLLVLGPTGDGRVLAVILDPELDAGIYIPRDGPSCQPKGTGDLREGTRG
jgi:uncharacterized protein